MALWYDNYRMSLVSSAFGPPAARPWARAIAATALLALALAAPVQAEEPRRTPQEIARAAFPAVVMVVLRQEGSARTSLGSGFFVGDGLVATNFHVIAGMTDGWVRLIGQEEKLTLAGVVAVDRLHDLAILKVGSGGPAPLPLGRSNALSVADKVYAIGNPHGLEGTFSEGLVSSIRRQELETMLQISAPISQGSSGGPVFDDRGLVVGVAVGMLEDGQNLNFAIPVDYLIALLGKLEAPVSLADAGGAASPPPGGPAGPSPGTPEAGSPEASQPDATPAPDPAASPALGAGPPGPDGRTPIDCGAFTCQLPAGWTLERNDRQGSAFSASRRQGGFAMLSVFYGTKAHRDVDDYAGAAIAGLGPKYLRHRVTELAGERAYLIHHRARVDTRSVLASDLRVIHADVEYTISLWSEAGAPDMQGIADDFEVLAGSWRWK